MAEIIGIKGNQLFELNVFHAKVVEQKGEDTLKMSAASFGYKVVDGKPTASDSTVMKLAGKSEQGKCGTDLYSTLHSFWLVLSSVFCCELEARSSRLFSESNNREILSCT